MAESRIWVQDREHAVGTHGPLIAQVWRGAHTYSNWRAESTPIFKHLEAISPKGCCVFIVIEEAAALPDKSARNELDLIAKERNNMIVSSVVLAAGGAGRTTVVRAIATAINIFSKGGMQVFSDPQAAIRTLSAGAQKVGVSIETAAVLQFVEKLRVVPH